MFLPSNSVLFNCLIASCADSTSLIVTILDPLLLVEMRCSTVPTRSKSVRTLLRGVLLLIFQTYKRGFGGNSGKGSVGGGGGGIGGGGGGE